jgi:L-fuconolactonase
MKRRQFLKAGVAAGVGSYLAPTEIPAKSLSCTREEDIPIIDTHMHLWDLEKMDYPWLEDRESPLSRNFLVPDYQKATEGCQIRKTVFVECARLPEQYLEEVDWVVGLAKEEPRIKGMVAYFPLEKGQKGIPEIEELTARQIVKGIRHGVNRELLGNAPFIKGLQLMPQYNLSFDLNISPPLMQEAIALIRQCPKTLFILDHLCNPNVKDQEISQWKKHLGEMAKIDHVYCKISGIITKADPKNWKNADLRPYIDHALETFGPDRVMFGGDWPVVLRTGSYKEWLSALQMITHSLSVEEKKQLFYHTAEKVYRL